MDCPRLDPNLPRRVGDWNLVSTLEVGVDGPTFEVKSATGAGVLTLLGEKAPEDPDATAAFMARMEAVHGFAHPGFVVPIDVGELDGRPWMVTEESTGVPLTRWYAARPVSTRDADLAGIGAVAARALGAAHARQLFHRDLHPDRITVDGQGAPLISGLGIVSDPWRPGVLCPDHEGDPRFKAPEQSRGESAERRTDVWGLAAVLYSVVAGHPPFEAESTTETLLQVRTRPAPRLSSSRDVAPHSLHVTIDRGLQRRLPTRHADMEAFADDLDAAARGDPVVKIESGLIPYFRERPGLILWFVGALLLCVFMVMSGWGWR